MGEKLAVVIAIRKLLIFQKVNNFSQYEDICFFYGVLVNELSEVKKSYLPSLYGFCKN